MRLLLDTHAFLWWLDNSPRLGAQARAAITDPGNSIFISAASAWEIAVKRASGRLDAPMGEIEAWIAQSSFTKLSIEVSHAIASVELPMHHRDPFDRLLIAQARMEAMSLVSRDTQIEKYDVDLLPASR